MYKVQWTFVKYGGKGARQSTIVSGTSYNIQGLSPLATYKIQVATMNWGRTGPYSEPIRVQAFDGGNCDINVVLLYSPLRCSVAKSIVLFYCPVYCANLKIQAKKSQQLKPDMCLKKAKKHQGKQKTAF